MAFGAWIRSEREKAGIALSEFARSINISTAYPANAPINAIAPQAAPDSPKKG